MGDQRAYCVYQRSVCGPAMRRIYLQPPYWFSGGIMADNFPPFRAENARQYTKYSLRFSARPTKNSLTMLSAANQTAAALCRANNGG